MTEPAAPEPGVTQPAVASAGALLRAARERQGLHIAALAAAIKVPQRKLEALEADRLDELPDAAFARALAQAVCRALKTDAQPVLALLPAPGDGLGLERVARGINAPFVGRPGRDDYTPAAWWTRPAVWLPALVLLAAAVVYLLPGERSELPEPDPVSVVPAVPDAAHALEEPPTPGEGAEQPVPGAVAPAAAPAPAVVARPSPAPAPEGVPAAALVLRASATSWVEVRDAGGQVLLSRTLQADESLTLDGRPPLRLTVGNAAATTVSFRGRAVDLRAVTRDNVARLNLE